jgi:hypothetical protein
MASLELLAAGAQADTGESTPVATDNMAGLVLVIDPIASNGGTSPQLAVHFETGPTETGPWREVASERLHYMDPPGSPHRWERRRVLIGAVDNFTRVRWSASSTGGSLSFGVAGTAVEGA